MILSFENSYLQILASFGSRDMRQNLLPFCRKCFFPIEMGQYLVPKLTTIQQPGFDLAERCVDILLQCICENKPAVNERIPFCFIDGESAIAL